MEKLVDGNVGIEVQISQTELTVSLEAVQYRLETISQYELFLKSSHILLAGKIVAASDESVEIVYEIPTYAQQVSTFLKKADLLERMEVARKFSSLEQGEGAVAQFFIHPDNLFLVSNQLYVAHRGLAGSIEPKITSSVHFLKQYKALVIHTLNSKYKYEDVVTGDIVIKDKTLGDILKATAVSEIEKILDEQYHVLHTARKVNERSVKKSRYSAFKFLTIGFAIVIVGIGIWLGLLLENTVPRQNRIIDSQAAFMINNFNEATSILSGDDPRTLPASVQYMLATSYIRLGTLTPEQRQAVINNLSPNSHENELRFWIYIGRGQHLEAIDIAYSLGDNQLKFHAYGLRYDYINADMEMPGAQKQEYLTRYYRRLRELRELLGGQDHEVIMPVVAPEVILETDEGYEEEAENGEE